jgi:nucleoside-diphosphate-sugar epimerase
MRDRSIIVTGSSGLIGRAVMARLAAAGLGAIGIDLLAFASSREVYGRLDRLPVDEDAPCRPIGAYARSKLEAEAEVGRARETGLRTAILRLSNVYGSMRDHPDRVVPAFVAAARRGGVMRVDGPDCALDLTHLDDVATGIERVGDVLERGERALPTLHFVSGERTTLRQLASLANELGGRRATIREAPPRAFGAGDFVGDPARARACLGWSATVPLRSGLARLMEEVAAPEPRR